VDIALISALTVVGLFAVYNLFHYMLFLLVTHPRDAGNIGHALNEFEERQLVEWTPKAEDFLKHDDENRTYDDVFGHYRGEHDNYSTCVFPRAAFTQPYDAECALLEPADGMRLLDLGCGSGAAADYLASRHSVEIVCVTNSSVQAEICRRKFEKFDGRVRVVVADFDGLDLPGESFDAIYALESIGYTKDLEAWLARCWRSLKPGFSPIRYRRLPFWAWGITWNFIQHLLLWKFRLRMRTMVELESIIWRTSKIFVFGNAYNVVLARKPLPPPSSAPMR